MSATWTLEGFDDPCDAKNYAEIVTLSGGRVCAITYGPICTNGANKWLVFAFFDEAFQRAEAERRWRDGLAS